MKKRILSGMRPTGKLHIGHWFGALENWVKLQDEYECFYMVADYHALTTPTDVKKIQQNIIEMVADWLACGLNPKKSVLFLQSQVPEHAELSLLLGMTTPLSWLMRCPTFKEQVKNYPDYVNFGLLGYPVLQAADIVIYKANAVPIGEDQLPHLELTREIVRKFNHQFNYSFPEPKPILSPTPKIMGLNRPEEKMSKSFGEQNYIALSDSPNQIREKIKKAVTDIGPQSMVYSPQKMSPGVKNLFELMKLFSPKETYSYFLDLYQKKTIKYVELKKVLAEDIIKYLEPIRKKREKIIKKPTEIKKILEKGAKTARPIAQETIKEVKKVMGLI